MEMRSEKIENVLIINIDGRLTANKSDQFKQFMNDLIGDNKKIVIDLSQMEYIDSTGLGALVSCSQRISDNGGRLKLACIQPRPQVVFDITKAYKIFDIYDSRDAAVAAMGEE